jgi:hypothetical protein
LIQKLKIMPRKLAIVISGAVSLGSYEAGVMYEVIEAISKHNQALAEDDEKRIEIDVITGASAGGMTACILVQHLLCDNGQLSNPYQNPLYQAWVREVNIIELLKVPPDKQKYSLLDSGVVDKIGHKHLKDKPKTPNQLHPAAAPMIQVGVAMSNLNGFSFENSKNNTNQGSAIFGYSQYKDQFVLEASRSPDGEIHLMEMTLEFLNGQYSWDNFRESTWSELRQMGLSSGAFPFAFRPRAIPREGAGQFLNRDSHKHASKGDVTRQGKYLYTDGGVFENEPIGMAKSFVQQIDQGLNAANRFYLYVAPGKREIDKDPLLNIDDDLLMVGIALLSAIFGQARFRDWITDNQHLNVFSITTNDTDLIGDVFSAFAGFLEEKFRAYDYNIGRENAQKALNEAAKAGLLIYNSQNASPIVWPVEGEKGHIHGNPVNSWPEAKALLGELAKVQINPRTNQRDQLRELQLLMHEVNPTTRKEIANQLTLRLDSLIDFINNDYLRPLDEVNDGSFLSKRFSAFKIFLRTWFGRPITKFVLWLFLKTWLERNILNPP